MILAADVTATLPELRAAAESLMVDTCVITRGDATPTWDEVTGIYTADPATAVYTGKCRVRMPRASNVDVQAGEAPVSENEVIVSLPVDTSGAVRKGDVVTLTACQFDVALVGVPAAVSGLHWQSHSTARRLRCKIEDRDGAL